MSHKYVSIPAYLMGAPDPDQQWINAQLDRIAPWRDEQGHDDAAKRVLSERDELLGLLTELMDTELAELACEGSYATVENLLGRIQATLTKHQPPATPAAKTS